MKLLRKINSLLMNIPAEFYFAMLLGYFFLCNTLMPLSHDDYAYAFVWDGDHGGNLDGMQADRNFEHRERVNSFSDIMKSQYSHYFTLGGRVIAHSIAQFFIWIGKPYFDVANTIIFALFVIVILKLSDIPLKKSGFAMFWIFISMFFVASRLAASITWLTWLTGACSYLWMSLFQLLFLWQYVQATRSAEINDSAIKIVVVTLMGISAGCSNEAGSLATVFLTIFLIYECRRLKTFSRWMVIGLVALIIGCVLCIFAPGNFAQTKFIQSVNPAFNYTATLLLEHFRDGFLPILAADIFVLMPMIYYFIRRGFCQLNISERLIIAFVAAGFIVPTVMMFSPKFDFSRVLVINLTFIIVSAIGAYRQAGGYIFKTKIAEVIFPVTVIMLLLYSASIIFSWQSLNREIADQIAYIRQHEGDESVIMPPLSPIPKVIVAIQGKESPILNYIGGISADENYCLNIMVAQYYGVKHIVAGMP